LIDRALEDEQHKFGIPFGFSGWQQPAKVCGVWTLLAGQQAQEHQVLVCLLLETMLDSKDELHLVLDHCA
jgi:hypothetical protein